MNTTILVATFLVELLLGVLHFIAMHLRAESQSRRLKKLPNWEGVDFDFRTDWYTPLTRSSDSDKGVQPPKLKIPRSRVK